jgi:hypothetical protein
LEGQHKNQEGEREKEKKKEKATCVKLEAIRSYAQPSCGGATVML